MILSAAPLSAQTRVAAGADVAFHKDPEGVELGTVLRSTPVTLGQTQGAWREVTLEGWIFTASTRPDAREGGDLSVSASPSENVRQVPNGRVLARLVTGVLLNRVETRGGWTRVRRTGWARASAFQPGATTASPAPAPTPARAAPAETTSRGERVELAAASPFTLVPEGDTVGSLRAGVAGRVVARSGPWVKVQVEGWVREEGTRPAEGGALRGVSAAEVRAQPSRFVGQLLEWRVQLISIQEADELRPELPSGREYLLTRGPLPESGFVYVVVPPEQMAPFRAAGPLAEFVLRGTLRTAATKYLAIPVLELVEALPAR